MKFIKALLLILLIISTECKVKNRISSTSLVTVQSTLDLPKESKEFIVGFITGIFSVLLTSDIGKLIANKIIEAISGVKTASESVNKECDYWQMVLDLLGFEKEINAEQGLGENIPNMHVNREDKCIIEGKKTKMSEFDTREKEMCVELLKKKLDTIESRLEKLNKKKGESESIQKKINQYEKRKEKINKIIDKVEPGIIEKAKAFCEKITIFVKKADFTGFVTNIQQKFEKGIEISTKIIKCEANEKINEIKNIIQEAESKSGVGLILSKALMEVINICSNKIAQVIKSIYSIIEEASKAKKNKEKKDFLEYGKNIGKIVGILISIIKDAARRRKFLKK